MERMLNPEQLLDMAEQAKADLDKATTKDEVAVEGYHYSLESPRTGDSAVAGSAP